MVGRLDHIEVVFDHDHGIPPFHKAVEERPGLILMDVHLAEGNGMAAARMLRDDPATVGIPSSGRIVARGRFGTTIAA